MLSQHPKVKDEPRQSGVRGEAGWHPPEVTVSDNLTSPMQGQVLTLRQAGKSGEDASLGMDTAGQSIIERTNQRSISKTVCHVL